MLKHILETTLQKDKPSASLPNSKKTLLVKILINSIPIIIHGKHFNTSPINLL